MVWFLFGLFQCRQGVMPLGVMPLAITGSKVNPFHIVLGK